MDQILNGWSDWRDRSSGIGGTLNTFPGAVYNPNPTIDLDELSKHVSKSLEKQWDEYFKKDFAFIKDEFLPYEKQLQKKLYNARKHLYNNNTQITIEEQYIKDIIYGK